MYGKTKTLLSITRAFSIIGKMWKKKKIGQKGRRKIEKQFLELAKKGKMAYLYIRKMR